MYSLAWTCCACCGSLGDVLVLASASPRRRELLERVGIAFTVAPTDIDESAVPGEPPLVYCQRIAREKAAAAAQQRPNDWILAADTVVACEGAILGKPEDAADATRMLTLLSGKTHEVHTAYVVCGVRTVERLVSARVQFRALTGGECASYVAAGEWQGKAGGYAVQGQAAAFVTAVHGSITAVIGLPLAEVVCDLRELGIAEPAFHPENP